MTIPSRHRFLEHFFSAWIFLATLVLLVVWALPHTIAARNIALFTGVVAALGWAWITKPHLTWKAFWPTLCLLLVPLWVLFHWYFISELRQQQWQELSSTWLRVTAAITLASAAGLILIEHPKRIWWLILAIVLLPTITFIQYIHQIYIQQHWILPSGIFYGIYKGKFSAVYFILCQVLVGFGLIYFALRHFQQIRVGSLIGGAALVLIGIGDLIAARALNGILVSFFALLLCIVALLFKGLRAVTEKDKSPIKNWKFGFLAFLVLVLVSSVFTLFWSYDQRQERKLANLVGDIRIASQIDQNQTWVRQGLPTLYPVDSAGREVNGSTYERVSWFIKGARLLKDHPLGNGISHMAFGYYMRAEYPGSSAVMTHSAWMDLALGMGVPGLLLTWGAIVGVIWRTQNPQNQAQTLSQIRSTPLLALGPIPEIALWLLAGMFCFWAIGEVSEREYLEHYLFLIALFTAALSPKT